MDKRVQHTEEFCPRYHRAVEMVGLRWAGAIIRAMMSGQTRFGGIRGAIPDLSNRMLSERLNNLEEEGIVERVVIPEKPVRVEYSLTEKGWALGPVVAALDAWADEWIEPETGGVATNGEDVEEDWGTPDVVRS